MNNEYKSEKEQEQYIADVCKKYSLDYVEGEGVYGTPEQLNDLENALKEIGKYLKNSDMIRSLRVNGKLCYYFTYETKKDKE